MREREQLYEEWLQLRAKRDELENQFQEDSGDLTTTENRPRLRSLLEVKKAEIAKLEELHEADIRR